MKFKTGDIIDYCSEYFEVKKNYGSSGTVYEVNDKFERTGTLISSFYWGAYGVKCKLVKGK